jgi:hypothetical protein
MPEIELNSFQRWVADMAQAVGMQLPSHLNPFGLELELDGRITRVLPHTDDAMAVIDVEIRSLGGLADGQAAGLAMTLLRINQDARFEHGWAVVLDDDDMLSISTTVSIAATSAHRLNEWLTEGLDRAQALTQAVAGMIDPATAQAGAAGEAMQNDALPDAPFGMIRG